MLRQRFTSALAAARTSSAWPSTDTFGQTWAILLVRSDQERRAHDAHEFSAIHRFFLPHAIGLQHPVLLIRGERYGELVLGLEGVLRGNRVGGDAEDLGAGAAEGALSGGRSRSPPWCSRGCRLGDRNRGRACARRSRASETVAAAVAWQRERRGLGAGVRSAGACSGQLLAGHMPSFRRFPGGILRLPEYARGRGWSIWGLASGSVSAANVLTAPRTRGRPRGHDEPG